MRKGFTLIEVLIVMGITGLLLAMIVAGQREFARRKVAENTAMTVVAKLRQAQTLSTSGVKPDYTVCGSSHIFEGYEVRFTADGFNVRATCYDGITRNEKITQEYDYPTDVTITDFPSSPLIFKPVGQGTNLSGSETIGICAFGYGQEVVITPQGDISARGFNCP